MSKRAKAGIASESKRRRSGRDTKEPVRLKDELEAGSGAGSAAPTPSGKTAGIHATVLEEAAPEPTRNAKGQLVFEGLDGFLPTLTPKQVLQAGAFGGTYFRPIKSGVTGELYANAWKEFPSDWFEGLSTAHISSKKYQKHLNRYGVKCGGSLEMWESSGWMSNLDPYGWFQWYCRAYLGRRTTDDERQVKRWRGVAHGRFQAQLINKCAAAGKTFDDVSVSPVIRQALLHWGYELTEADANAYLKKKGKPPLVPAE